MKIIERIKLAKLFFSTIKYIIPAIGFLPSEVSGKLHIKSGNDEKIHVTYIENNQTTKYLRNADQNFNNLISKIGFFKIPLRYPKKIGIGVGVHIGASIPMGSNNVDNYGQIPGFEDIHVVDASVLPRIFPGGHTLATMANAYRIANHVS
jgi:choline dehydrogenase-like flavoprotein